MSERDRVAKHRSARVSVSVRNSEITEPLKLEQRAALARPVTGQDILRRRVVDPQHLEGKPPLPGAEWIPVQAASKLVAASEPASDERGTAEGFELAGNQEIAGLQQPTIIKERIERHLAPEGLEVVEPSKEVLAGDAQAAVLEGGIDRPELHVR